MALRRGIRYSATLLDSKNRSLVRGEVVLHQRGRRASFWPGSAPLRNSTLSSARRLKIEGVVLFRVEQLVLQDGDERLHYELSLHEKRIPHAARARAAKRDFLPFPAR